MQAERGVRRKRNKKKGEQEDTRTRKTMALLTPYWGLDGLLVSFSFLVAIYLYMTRKFRYWEKRGIVEPQPSPFVGNFGECLLLKKSPGEYVRELYESGKGLRYMGFYVFDKPFFLVRDPELVKHVLVKDFNVFADRYAKASVNDRLGYANLFIIRNPAWKVLRAKLTPIFTSGKLKKMFELMTEVADDLDNYLESQQLNAPGKTIEAKDLCANFTTDLIGTTAYGFRVNSINNPKTIFREHGRKIFSFKPSRGIELLSIFFAPWAVPFLRSKFFGKESSEFLRSIFWDAINHRMETGAKRNDLIDLLIELKKAHEDTGDLGGFRFDGDDLVAQAAIFFTGGFETSSTTMSLTLYELALQPEIQTKLRNEINNALEETNGKITYDMAMNLPYLDMVVSEVLRKYPPLPFLDRVTGEDYKVPGSDLVLEKGTPVYISMTGLHYDPEYFPDPQKFDPERFNEENKKNRPGFVYFPFGDGPHVCIGLRLGLLQAKLGIIRILSKYKVSPCEKTAVPLKLDPKALITTALNGVFLNIQRVTGDSS